MRSKLLIAICLAAFSAACDPPPQKPKPPASITVRGMVVDVRIANPADKLPLTHIVMRHDNGMVTSTAFYDVYPPVQPGDRVEMTYEIADAQAGIYHNVVVLRRLP